MANAEPTKQITMANKTYTASFTTDEENELPFAIAQGYTPEIENPVKGEEETETIPNPESASDFICKYIKGQLLGMIAAPEMQGIEKEFHQQMNDAKLKSVAKTAEGLEVTSN